MDEWIDCMDAGMVNDERAAGWTNGWMDGRMNMVMMIMIPSLLMSMVMILMLMTMAITMITIIPRANYANNEDEGDDEKTMVTMVT